MIRACVDANLLISHLLKPTADGPPNRVVRAALAQQFHLILIETTLQEMLESVRTKPYLAARIEGRSALDLEAALRLTVTVIPELVDDIPSLTRDPGDDYLIVHALLMGVDYLVSGDHDLLELGEFEGIRIVSPAEFVELLEA